MVELIVVVVILGVLMAVLVPQYIQYVERSRVQADEAYIGEIAHAMEIIASSNEVVAGGLGQVTIAVYPTEQKSGYFWDGGVGEGGHTLPALKAMIDELEDIIGKGSPMQSKLYNSGYTPTGGVIIALDKNGKAVWIPKSAKT